MPGTDGGDGVEGDSWGRVPAGMCGPYWPRGETDPHSQVLTLSRRALLVTDELQALAELQPTLAQIQKSQPGPAKLEHPQGWEG